MILNKDTTGFVTIDNIISSYMINPANKGRNIDIDFVEDAAIRGFMYLNTFSVMNVRKVQVIPNANNMFMYPSDMIENGTHRLYFNVDGEVYPIAPNHELVTSITGLCGADYRDAATADSLTSDWSYNIDKENHWFVIQGAMPLDYELWLEYQTSGVSTTKETVVPLYMVEVIMAWIDWQYEKKNTTLMNIFGAMETQLRRFVSKTTMDEFLAVRNKTMMLNGLTANEYYTALYKI